MRKFTFFFLAVFLGGQATLSAVRADDDALTYQFLLSPIPPLVMAGEGQVEQGLLWDIAQNLLIRLRQDKNCQCDKNPLVLPWNRAVNIMDNEPGRFMLQMARTQAREDLYHWIAPTAELSFAFVTQNQYPPENLIEAKKLDRIAVYRGSRLEKYLRAQGFDKSLIGTNNSDASARLLNHNRVQAWYASVDEALWFYKKGVLTIRPFIGEAILRTPVWAIASKGTPLAKVEAVRTLLNDMIKDGTIDELKKKYGLDAKALH